MIEAKVSITTDPFEFIILAKLYNTYVPGLFKAISFLDIVWVTYIGLVLGYFYAFRSLHLRIQSLYARGKLLVTLRKQYKV